MSGRALSKEKRIIIIAVAALLAIVIVGVCVLRFGFPSTWESLIDALFKEDELYNGVLSVRFLDVGQGDSIYISFPDGSDMLIDCGSTKGYSAAEAIAALTALNGDGRIDRIMLTHSDQDHVAYLDEVLQNFEVRDIYMPNILASPKTTTQSGRKLAAEIGLLSEEKLAMFTDPDVVDSNAYAEFFIAALSEPDCAVHLNMDPDARSNGIIIRGETYTFTFYCPTAEYYAETSLNTALKLNAVSPVGILEYNRRRVVFTGDSNELNEPTIAARLGSIDCDVLKVAHHGSATSSCNEFLNAVDCEYAVISCGEGNSYGHPAQSALNRFAARRMTVYRTDLNGEITLTVNSDGELSFSLERPSDQKANLNGY